MKTQYNILPNGRLFTIYGDERIWCKNSPSKAYCNEAEVYLIMLPNQDVFTTPGEIFSDMLMQGEKFSFIPGGHLYTIYDKVDYDDYYLHSIGDNQGAFFDISLPDYVYVV